MLRPADNPFASHRIERLQFRPQGLNWDDLLRRLEALRYRACILGQQGSGKTTLLEQLDARLKAAGHSTHLHLHHAARPVIPWASLRRMTSQDILLFDGADLLPRATWLLLRLITRHLGGLVVVSHSRKLLPPLLTCQTSPGLLADLLQELAPDRFTIHSAWALYDQHQGNLRECLRAAYDLSARAPEQAVNLPWKCGQTDPEQRPKTLLHTP